MILCLVLILQSFLLPVNAVSHTWFDKWRIWEIDGSTWLQHQDYFTNISGEDYVGLVCAAMAINQDFRSVFTDVPYSFPEIDLQHNNGNTWYGSTVAMRVGTLTRRSGNTATYVGAYYIGSSATVNWSTFFFPEAQTYFSSGNSNFKLAADNNSDLMVYVPGSNPAADSVLGQLNQLNTTLSQLSTLQSTANTSLSNIFNAVSNTNTSLSVIASRLTDVNTKLQNIYTHINNLETLVSTNNSLLEDVKDYVTDYFPSFDDDLYNINENLYNFYNSFLDYADDVRDYLYSIDQNVASIDESLDEFMELYNGTPLQQVPVRNSSSPNLWGLIKNGVSAGLNGFGQLFDLIFNAIGFFSSDVNGGFDSIMTIDEYQSVTYNPQILVYSSINFPNFEYTTKGVTFSCSNGSVTVSSVDSNTGYAYYRPSYSQSLSPGTYRINATGNSNVVVYVQTESGYQTLANSASAQTFSISQDVNVVYQIRGNCVGVYSYTFIPNLEKVS